MEKEGEIDKYTSMVRYLKAPLFVTDRTIVRKKIIEDIALKNFSNRNMTDQSKNI